MKTNKEEEILKEFREKVAGNEYYFTTSRDDDYNENYEEWEKWLTQKLSEVRSEGRMEGMRDAWKKIEDIAFEFGDRPATALSIIAEYVGESLHFTQPPAPTN